MQHPLKFTQNFKMSELFLKYTSMIDDVITIYKCIVVSIVSADELALS